MSKPKNEFGIDPDISRGRMFLGTFDDSVSRNPWKFLNTESSNLTNTLIYHALLGPRLCCRIGNIIYHPAYFDAFMNSYTPLNEFASTGFFQFHTKGRSFNDSIEIRKNESTNSTLDWIEKTGWAKGSSVYRAIDNLQTQIGEKGSIQYSPSFHRHFQFLSDQVVSDSNEHYRHVYSIWSERCLDLNRTRSEFEKICDTEFGMGSENKLSAMSIVNSVNHYAYGLSLSSISRQFDEKPIIETNEVMKFNKLTRSLIDSNESLNSDHLIDMISKKVFDSLYKHLKFPVELFDKPDNWKILASLVGIEHSRKSRDFVELKRAVLLEIRNALEGMDSWKGPVELEKACKNYSNFLCKELGTRSSKLARFSMSISLPIVGKNMLYNALSDTLKSGVNSVFSAAASSVAGQFALSVFANVVIEILADPVKYQTRRIMGRVKMAPAGRSDYFENFAPMVNALCVKQIDMKAVLAAEKNELNTYFDTTKGDSF
jgi:hypothetical protein